MKKDEIIKADEQRNNLKENQQEGQYTLSVKSESEKNENDNDNDFRMDDYDILESGLGIDE